MSAQRAASGAMRADVLAHDLEAVRRDVAHLEALSADPTNPWREITSTSSLASARRRLDALEAAARERIASGDDALRAELALRRVSV